MASNLPFQLGITGGIGSGKSVLAKIFSLLDVPVYESDTEARKLYLKPEIRKQVESLLGTKAYRPDGQPDTAYIAAEIYAKPSLRESLNAILHPAVGADYQTWLEKQSHPYILKVAALLFEADIASKLNFTALVVSPMSLKKERVSARDPHRPSSQIDAIMENQWSDEKKMALADIILYNDENHSLIEQVNQLNNRILQLASK